MNDDRQDRLKEHSYDGIQEYDNRLPNWWLTTLYGAMGFAVVYWLFFHTWSWGSLTTERYDHEMAVAAEAQLERMEGQEISNESLLLTAAVPAHVEAGQAVFAQFCVQCHKADASGDVGPNLTDEYWLHGAQPLQILDVVTNGVADKGMAAWMNQLGPRRVQDVVAFVLSIKGTKRPGKAPQGEKESVLEPGETPAESSL